MPDQGQHIAILDALKQSAFRARFTLTRKDRDYIRAKGISVIREHAIDFISKRIAPANPDNDGRQTPMRNHPVFVAQHATATCCRGCLEKWHHIPKGIQLKSNDVQRLVYIIMAWIDREMDHEKDNIEEDI